MREAVSIRSNEGTTMSAQDAFQLGESRRSAQGRAIVNTSSLGNPIELMGTAMSYARNMEIYGEGEPAEYLYKVLSGAVRTSRVLADGRRQIGSFYLPGEVFGMEGSEEHAFSAEAITDAKIVVIKRTALDAMAARDAEVSRLLWTITGQELQCAQRHVMLLIKTAKERVVGFLLEMASRVPNSGNVALPMSRQDIADYLGLTIETVSRTLSELERVAAIELPSSRQVVLRNRAALGRLNG